MIAEVAVQVADVGHIDADLDFVVDPKEMLEGCAGHKCVRSAVS